MRIAYFSPLLPHSTGVASYSEHLVPYLREHAEIDLYSARYPAAQARARGVRDLEAHPERVLHLARHVALYHLGNNPFFHLHLFRALLRRPGVVVLHDTVLYYLSAGQGVGGLLKDLGREHGASAVTRLRQILAESPDGDPLRFPHPERYPLLRRPVEAASQIIVHSQHAARAVAAVGLHKPVHVIPHLIYPSVDTPERARAAQALRERIGLAPGELLISSLGFVGPTKRLPSVLHALAGLPRSLRYRFAIVGQGGGELMRLAQSLGIAENVHTTDFVTEDEFATWLAASDLVINLRHPSMGETSGTVAQAMFLRRPCVVTDDGWFSELPDDAVVKIPIENEVQHLGEVLLSLARNAEWRQRVGAAARRWIEETAHPRVVARRYLDVLAAEVPAGREVAPPAEAPPRRRTHRARPRRAVARRG